MQELVEAFGEESAQEKVAGKYKVLRFDDLYEHDPRVCPVYYSYIIAMYNPAIVGSESFVEELYHSKIIQGNGIPDKEKKAYASLRRESSNGHALDRHGQQKGEFLLHLEDQARRTAKKAKKAMQDRHPSYLRDIRTLSLILYRALTTKEDTVFHTTDGDHGDLLLKWFDAMTVRQTLIKELQPHVNEAEIQTLTAGGTVQIYLDYAEFVRRREEMQLFVLRDDFKQSGVRITVRRWNQLERRYEQDIWLTFTDTEASVLSNSHSNLWCYFTQNNTFGNALRFVYYWPPADPSETRIRVEVKQKTLNHTSEKVSAAVHSHYCKYRKDDASGAIADWSGFIGKADSTA